MKGNTSDIHSTAIIHKGAELGQDVKVGPYAIIYGPTQIGDGCSIGPHAIVYPYTTLGMKCRIHAGAILADLPQDVAFEGVVESYLTIGDRTILREGFTAHRGTGEGSTTSIGSDCFLMGHVHVAHNARLGNGVLAVNGTLIAGHAEIQDGAFLSGNVAVHQFVRVGRLAMMGGGSTATKDVPPFCTTPPVTNNRVVGLNVVGLRRAGISPEDRLQLKSAFRRFYLFGTNMRGIAEELRAEKSEGPVHEFAEFILASKRGVCAHLHPPRSA